jgi:hypothetical protein
MAMVNPPPTSFGTFSRWKSSGVDVTGLPLLCARTFSGNGRPGASHSPAAARLAQPPPAYIPISATTARSKARRNRSGSIRNRVFSNMQVNWRYLRAQPTDQLRRSEAKTRFLISLP